MNHGERRDWGAAMPERTRAIMIDPRDSVATALADLPPGTAPVIGGRDAPPIVELKQAIPFGHKFAVVHAAPGDEVIKYGESIGVALRDIEPGDHVHTHNLGSRRGGAP